MKFYEDEVYVKMCEKAKEIQKLQPTCKEAKGSYFRYGDFPDDFYPKGRYRSDYVFIKCHDDIQEESVWLPRQDQLQEMLFSDFFGENNRANTQRCLIMFNDWWKETSAMYGKNKSGNPNEFFETFEQCWLAFVMKQRFNKTWDSEKEEWV